ncbi:MAG TPA: CPBP family intramembrane glutamic endopeptidase, partial [Terriglobales bacterium]|nr:CPBP family intramembrane glutamic endopeptidase [Terriglobales bacterium]
MTTNKNSQITTALSVAIGIFIIAILLPKLIFSSVLPLLMTTQGLELLLSLLAIIIFGKSKFSEYGFCQPKTSQQPAESRGRWIRISLIAPLLGMVATPLILGLGGNGNPLVKNLTFPQIVLFVWVFSSVIEEVFTRGFLQGHLSVLSGRYFRLLFFRVELPVMISALFFACMHFALLFRGIDAITMVVTFIFTFSIGLMAGYLRAKTGSLIPAIAVHMLANIGGMIGGVIYALINFIVTG